MATVSGAETAASYGISEALLIAYPELKIVYDLFKAEKTAEALEALYKTSYYRNTSPTVKQREQQKLTQPAVYADSVAKYKAAAQKRLVSAGIRIDTTTFDSIVSQAYAKGMDDNQLDQALATSGKITGFGGTILGDTTSLKTFASSYGVNMLLNDAYWNQKSQDLFSGTLTYEDIQAEIKTLAASAYPAYAEGFERNQSLDAQASNIKQSIATVLERDPDSIGYDDPLMKQLLNYQDPTTKKPAKAPQYIVDQTIKSTNDWLLTDNAIATFDSLSMKVLKDWGLA